MRGDKQGRPVSPLEDYGSVYPVKTFVHPNGKARYADITTLHGTESIVFSSFNTLLEHVSLVAQFCIGEVASMIVSDIVTPSICDLPWDDTEEDPDKNGFLSGDNENKSVRQKIIEYLEEQPEAKTFVQISHKFPDIARVEIETILLHIPILSPIVVDQEVAWSLTEDEEFGTDIIDDDCLMHYMTGLELKNAVVGQFCCLPEFVDKESDTVALFNRLSFLSRLGFECYSQTTIDGKTTRCFRRRPI